MGMVTIVAAALVALIAFGWMIFKWRSRQRINHFLKANGGKACPRCKQYVSRVALVCRNCGHRFDM